MTALEIIQALVFHPDYKVVGRGYEQIPTGNDAEVASIVIDRYNRTFILGVVEADVEPARDRNLRGVHTQRAIIRRRIQNPPDSSSPET